MGLESLNAVTNGNGSSQRTNVSRGFNNGTTPVMKRVPPSKQDVFTVITTAITYVIRIDFVNKTPPLTLPGRRVSLGGPRTSHDRLQLMNAGKERKKYIIGSCKVGV